MPPRRHDRSPVLAALAVAGLTVAGLAAGCASHPTRGLGTAVDTDAILKQVMPGQLAGRRLPALAVVVTVTSRKATELTGEHAQELGLAKDAVTGDVMDSGMPDGPAAYPVNPAILADTVVAGLRALDVFEDVYLVGGGAGEDQETTRTDHFFLLREATGRGAALLVEFRLDDAKLLHLGGEEAISTLLWALTGIGNQWIPNETFRLSFVPSVRVFDINAAEFLPERPLGSAEATATLNFHERTGSLWTYVTTNLWPSNFTRPDPKAVTRGMAPMALTGPLSRFADYLAEVTDGREYSFEVLDNQSPALPVAQVYPSKGKNTLVLTDKLHLELAFDATGDNRIAEVKLNDQVLWPRGLKDGEALPPRKRYVFRSESAVADRALYSFSVTDTEGHVTRYALRARKVAGEL